MAATLNLEEIWGLQKKLMSRVEPGTLIEDAMEYTICVKCNQVYVPPDDGSWCACDYDG
jgi:hypothetical protein